MEALPEILCWTGFVERKRLGWLRGGRVAEVARRSSRAVCWAWRLRSEVEVLTWGPDGGT